MIKDKNEKNRGDELSERLLDFTVRIIKLVNSLPKTAVGRHISGQILRSGTANCVLLLQKASLLQERKSKFEMLIVNC